MNESECYRFYFGQSTVLNVIEHPIRLGLIDLITITSLAIYLIFLIVTLPNAIRRFRRKKGSKALRLGYYIFIWADVVSRSIRQIIISAVYKGIPAEDGLSVSVRLINETVYFTSELGVMIFMVNGLVGSKRTMVQRAITQIIITFISLLLIQIILLFGAKLPIYTGTQPGVYIFSLLIHTILCIPYTLVIIFKLRKRFRDKLPSRKWFYVFVVSMLGIHFFHVLSFGMLIGQVDRGYCVLAFTKALSTLIYVPLLYFAFLANFLHKKIKSKLAIEIDYEYSRLDSDTQGYSDFTTDLSQSDIDEGAPKYHSSL